ncbi:MAG: cupin domain-containing protein [Luminiphilus sp.]|nr:cupin domain-containing protein [Luminiphilus sp.]
MVISHAWLVLRAFVLLLGLVACCNVAAQPGIGVTSDLLLRESVQGVPSKELIVSRVTLPPHTELPWHWHPGEEVFYVIEGEVTLARRGEPDTLSTAGEANTIAPRVVHTGRTGEAGATLVIFRVHDKGQPERVLAE